MNLSRPKLRLAPSLLSADFAALGESIVAAERGGADAFHLDVMDGHFVPNISFGPALVKAVRARTRLPLDVHLMISEPGRYLSAFREAGGDTLVVHLEVEADAAGLLRSIRELGAASGIAVRPDTPVERVLPLLGLADQVMVMGVMPGFSGQRFRPEALPKIRWVREQLDRTGSTADISIDGGVTVETGGEAARAGASFFVCGSSVFDAGEVGSNLARLRSAVEEGADHAVR
ncbi:MAG: ribulose-phosphate 3-epimerase [Thermoplasmata archaeon]|nr:ribulose-phosphate 3-epimerase [Thermoplasmata archaeon]